MTIFYYSVNGNTFSDPDVCLRTKCVNVDGQCCQTRLRYLFLSLHLVEVQPNILNHSLNFRVIIFIYLWRHKEGRDIIPGLPCDSALLCDFVTAMVPWTRDSSIWHSTHRLPTPYNSTTKGVPHGTPMGKVDRYILRPICDLDTVGRFLGKLQGSHGDCGKHNLCPLTSISLLSRRSPTWSSRSPTGPVWQNQECRRLHREFIQDQLGLLIADQEIWENRPDHSLLVRFKLKWSRGGVQCLVKQLLLQWPH